MVEMLGVIAVMGVLSVAGIAGYNSAMNRHRANAVINDSKMVYMDAHARQTVSDTDWQDVSYHFESGKSFQVMRDKKQNDYVKVLGVDQAVCNQILNMATKNVLAFLNEDYTEMTSCGQENNIVIAWNGLGAPAECTSTADCGENFPGICNPDGHCHECDEASERLNEDGTACECDPNKTLICQDEDENSWCCGPGLICDIENKGCKNGGGVCMYNFTQQVQTKAANCRYFISAQTQTKAANCHYQITDTDNGGNLHSITMTLQGKACAPDEYCYIGYFDESCTSSINRGNVGATTTEDVWGTCLKRTAASSQCNISSISTNFMEEWDGCEADEYCYIAYFDENCSSPINRGGVGATTTEDVWGTCLKRTAANTQCNISEITLGGLSEVQGCPVGQYCSIKWEGNTCSTVINRGAVTGPMLGACIERTSNTVNQCPIQTEGE